LGQLKSTSRPEVNRRAATIRRLTEVDWDFATESSDSPFSALHWHPCRFPSQVPSIAIGRLSNLGDVVLDPFMGSGTSIVEAQRLGRHSIGIDVNPISCLMARAKTMIHPFPVVEKYIDRMVSEVALGQAANGTLTPPPTVQVEKWYAPETANELCRIWALVSEDGSDLSDLSLAAFSSILLACCKETRHWGYVCDNSEPKTNRIGDARGLFIRALRKIKSAYEIRSKAEGVDVMPARVLQGSSSLVLKTIADESVSCVVTSPPYLGVADYAKAQRLSMEWLGLEIEPVRQEEIGARSKRHRKSAAGEFLRDLSDVFTQCTRVLRSGGYMVAVYGSSPKRDDTSERFISMLQLTGLCVEAVFSRSISDLRRQNPSLLNENVIVMRKD
jgi:hypothetical protein